MKTKLPDKKGELDIYPEIHDGSVPEVCIYGDPEGLRYLAELLIWLADVNQNETDAPVGTREHMHLHKDCQLGTHSNEVLIYRSDAKGSGELVDFMQQ